MRVILIVDRDVAKIFGVELDESLRPLREKKPCGPILTTKPKGVPPHIQKKFIEFLDSIECSEDYNKIASNLKRFQAIKLQHSKYTKKMAEIARNLLLNLFGIKIEADKIRLLRAKLGGNYRVTFGFASDEGGEIRIFILIVEAGSREGYYK